MGWRILGQGRLSRQELVAAGQSSKQCVLRLIGYWHSDQQPHWPDPAWFVDETWDRDERARVVTYLRAAYVPWAAAGLSWCRFRCAVRGVGSAEHTDGTFVWPAGLAHYVECHNVRLPDEFTRHALASTPPLEVDVSFEAPMDTNWWAAQRGHGQGVSFRSPTPVGNFEAVVSPRPPSAELLAALREFALIQQLSLVELQRRIREGATFELLTLADEMPRPPELSKLDALGIPIVFRDIEDVYGW